MALASINQQDGNGRTKLHLACQDDEPLKVKKLLDQGADITICDEIGFTAAHIAIECESIQVLRFLAAAVDLKSIKDRENGGNLLHFATQMGNLEVVKILIEAGVSVSEIDNDGWMPLNFAVMNNPEIVKLLLQAGSNVHYRHPDTGYTPLFSAVYAGNQKICELLLEAGADVNENQNPEKRTPIMETRKKSLIAYLELKGATRTGKQK